MAKKVSQRDNVQDIAIDISVVDRTLAGMGRVWDAVEMGITREEAERRAAAARTPEARQRVIDDLKQRALKRADLDVSTGEVAVVTAGGEPAWHQLGKHFDGALGSAEMIVEAKLDYTVSKTRLQLPNGKPVNSWALVREDTGAVLMDHVGGDYKVIQNREGFAFIDAVLIEHGARYTTAGACDGGRRVWMLAEFPKQAFTLTKGDRQLPYVLFTNAHGGEKGRCFPTAERPVCANTLRLAMGRRDRALEIIHSGDINRKVKLMQQVLGIAVEGFASFKERAEQMVRQDLEPIGYFDRVFQSFFKLDELGAELIAAAKDGFGLEDIAMRINRARERKNKWLERSRAAYAGPTCKPWEGSAWAAYNAVSFVADHEFNPRRDAEATMTSIVEGLSDNLKQTAWQLAV